jgi:hypothetical protein
MTSCEEALVEEVMAITVTSIEGPYINATTDNWGIIELYNDKEKMVARGDRKITGEKVVFELNDDKGKPFTKTGNYSFVIEIFSANMYNTQKDKTEGRTPDVYKGEITQRKGISSMTYTITFNDFNKLFPAN